MDILWIVMVILYSYSAYLGGLPLLLLGPNFLMAHHHHHCYRTVLGNYLHLSFLSLHHCLQSSIADLHFLKLSCLNFDRSPTPLPNPLHHYWTVLVYCSIHQVNLGSHILNCFIHQFDLGLVLNLVFEV